MPKNVSEETQKEAKHTEGAELKQRRWHYVFSFLSSQKKQNKQKQIIWKVTQFKTENLYHIHDMSSELFSHFDIVPICSNFHKHLSSTCFYYSNCNHMHSYDCLFLIWLKPMLFSFPNLSGNRQSKKGPTKWQHTTFLLKRPHKKVSSWPVI